ncbi:MAG: helix-turn-helix domain-containing protein [Flavobacterium sp.]
MFYLFGVLLAFFLSVILLTKKGKTKSDLILAYWLLLIAIHLSLFYISKAINPYYEPLLILGFPFPLIHGPMLYFYTASLTNQHVYLKKLWVCHLLPLFFGYAILIPFFRLPHGKKIIVLQNKGAGFELESDILNSMIDLSGIIYVMLSLWLLYKHRKSIQNRFSTLQRVNLNWLQYLVYSLGLIWISVLWKNDLIIYSLVTLFVVFLGYFGIKQVGIFTENTLTVKSVSIKNLSDDIYDKPVQTKTKYLNSNISEEALAEIHQKLTQIILVNKPYLNPDLTLTELANLINIHPNTLSQTINIKEANSFYDFINNKRVEEFKTLVIQPESQKFTMLSLAYECGFNSKTAFYRSFKKNTSQTPTMFLKQEHIKLSS